MGTLKYINPHEIGCFWYDAAEKYGSPNVKWCEETLCQVISEPANTWSNLIYMILGLALIFQFKGKSKSLMLLGPFLFITGACSYYYHMANIYISQVFDFLGMFILVHWFITLNLQRLKNISFKKSVIIMLSITIIHLGALHIMYLYGLKYQLLIVVGALIIFTLEILIRRKEKNYSLNKLALGVSIIVFAEVFSLLDLKRILCDPTNHFFQGHALWHVLGAIGLYICCHFYKQFDEQLK